MLVYLMMAKLQILSSLFVLRTHIVSFVQTITAFVSDIANIIILSTIRIIEGLPGDPVTGWIADKFNEAVTSLFTFVQTIIFALLVIPLGLFNVFSGAVDIFSGITTIDDRYFINVDAADFPQVAYNGYLAIDSMYLFDIYDEFFMGDVTLRTMSDGSEVWMAAIAMQSPKDMRTIEPKQDCGYLQHTVDNVIWRNIPAGVRNNDPNFYVNGYLDTYRNRPGRMWLNRGVEADVARVLDLFRTGRSSEELGIDFRTISPEERYGFSFNTMTADEFRDWYFKYHLYGSARETGSYLVPNSYVHNASMRTFEFSMLRWNSRRRFDYDLVNEARAWGDFSPAQHYFMNRRGQVHYGEIDIRKEDTLIMPVPEVRFPDTRGNEAMRIRAQTNRGNAVPIPENFGSLNAPVILQMNILCMFFFHIYRGRGFYITYKNETFYPAAPIWQDYINHFGTIVDDFSKRTDDPARYTSEFQLWMEENAVEPGSDNMYRLVANSILSGDDLVANQVSTTSTSRTLIEIFIGQNAVSYAFWGITLIAMALCIAFSIVAVIRSMGNLEGKLPLGKTIGGIGKAMLTFLLIPFMVMVTVNLSSVLIRQLDIVMGMATVYEPSLLEQPITLTPSTPDPEPVSYAPTPGEIAIDILGGQVQLPPGMTRESLSPSTWDWDSGEIDPLDENTWPLAVYWGNLAWTRSDHITLFVPMRQEVREMFPELFQLYDVWNPREWDWSKYDPLFEIGWPMYNQEGLTTEDRRAMQARMPAVREQVRVLYPTLFGLSAIYGQSVPEWNLTKPYDIMDPTTWDWASGRIDPTVEVTWPMYRARGLNGLFSNANNPHQILTSAQNAQMPGIGMQVRAMFPNANYRDFCETDIRTWQWHTGTIDPSGNFPNQFPMVNTPAEGSGQHIRLRQQIEALFDDFNNHEPKNIPFFLEYPVTWNWGTASHESDPRVEITWPMYKRYGRDLPDYIEELMPEIRAQVAAMFLNDSRFPGVGERDPRSPPPTSNFLMPYTWDWFAIKHIVEVNLEKFAESPGINSLSDPLVHEPLYLDPDYDP